MKKNICEVCSSPLSGTMIFYPKLCLKCVVDLDNKAKKKDKKSEKSSWHVLYFIRIFGYK